MYSATYIALALRGEPMVYMSTGLHIKQGCYMHTSPEPVCHLCHIYLGRNMSVYNGLYGRGDGGHQLGFF